LLSNVARVRAVADAARIAGCEVVWSGRPAMGVWLQVARETGYLDGVQNFRRRRISTAIFRPRRCWRSAREARASGAPRWRASPMTIIPR